MNITIRKAAPADAPALLILNEKFNKVCNITARQIEAVLL